MEGKKSCKTCRIKNYLIVYVFKLVVFIRVIIQHIIDHLNMTAMKQKLFKKYQRQPIIYIPTKGEPTQKWAGHMALQASHIQLVLVNFLKSLTETKWNLWNCQHAKYLTGDLPPLGGKM